MPAFSPDPIQPEVEFSFGWQPKEFRGKDKEKSFGVIGVNDVWSKFIGPQLIQRGGELYLHDLDQDRSEAARQKAQAHGSVAHAVNRLEDMPNNLQGIYILTPPASHLLLVKQIAGIRPGLPIAVEKPLTGNREDMVELAQFVRESRTPLYGVDWALLNAQPLFHAVGMKTAFSEALDMRNAERFKGFDFKNTVKIDGRDIEGGGNSLADPKAVAANRPWMLDFRKGGGVLYDMTVHITNVLAAMGVKNTVITDVILGSPTEERGVYRRIADDKTGELYARAHGRAEIAGGNPSIETVIESGKGAAHNDQFIRLTDPKGNVLHWEIIPTDEQGLRIPGSKLEMLDAQGKIVAKAAMYADCYALAVEQFSLFVAEHKKKATPGIPVTPSHFETHDAGLQWVAAMHDVARSPERRNLDGQIVRQLALMETPQERRTFVAWQNRDAVPPGFR